MRQTLYTIALLFSIIISFLAGSYHGYSTSPGSKEIKVLKEEGMTDEEIENAIANISEYTDEYLETLHREDMTGAIMGLNTLKALKDKNLAEIEGIAIGQIVLYYNIYSGELEPDDEFELKLHEEILDISEHYPDLKKEVNQE